ncbi:TIR domain-containing protein [uncultured Roseobacter sp.]|uniref:TIR domain-containing protein n=1 Tax=uncultured Roseobacter sp. TaxID=114847 RepID=UPI00263836F2|nr:TIR domain-containing protein [uncultured Roseobacter sp.]
MTKLIEQAHPEFSPNRIFISYSRADGREFAEDFEKRVAEQGLTSWRDLKDIESDDVRFQALRAIEQAEHLVLVLSKRALVSDWVKREYRHAWAKGKRVSPVLGDASLRKRDLPLWLRRAEVYDLSEPERFITLLRVLEGPGERRRVPFHQGHLPSSYVRRSTEFGALKTSVMASGGGSVALVGSGGYGKTVLANDLCRDEEVRFQFWDGILRVEIGKERPSVLGLVNDLIEKLDPDGARPGFTDETMAGEHLGGLIGEASLLLVIDDVWYESQLRPFLYGGPNCVRLITTRKPSVLPQDCTPIRIDEMRQTEALQLLSWDLNVVHPATRVAFDSLAGRLEGWAQLLDIANGFVRSRVAKHESVDKALGTFQDRLDRRGLTAFDARDEDQRNRAIGLCVDASTEDLDDALERPRFRELAVLPEDVAVPIDIIDALWNQSGQFDLLETEELLERLDGLSLLQELDLGTRTVRLHDNMKWLLRDRLGEDGLTEAHSKMVEALAASCVSDWASMPKQASYGWRFLIDHLRAAGRGAEADRLLTDFIWIKTRLAVTGAQGLLAAWHDEPEDPAAQLVGRAVALSIPALAQSPDQLSHQIWGRLADAGLPAAVEVARSARSTPSLWPVPTCPRLTPPGQLRFGLVGHTMAIQSAMFSPDGSRVFAAAGSEVKVWNSATGVEIASLPAYGAWSPIVFSPFGNRVLTLSNDGTARVWDVASGAQIAVLEMPGLTNATFSPDGTRVLNRSEDGTVRLHDAASGVEAATLGKSAKAVFSPYGSRVLTLSPGHGNPMLWDTVTGNETAVLGVGEAWVKNAAFSPDGHQVLTVFDEDLGRRETADPALWDAGDGGLVRELKGHAASVHIAVFSPDGTRVLTASKDRTARLWDANTGRETGVLACKFAAQSVQYSPNNDRAFATFGDGTLVLWDTINATELASLNSGSKRSCTASFSPDGRYILARGWDCALLLNTTNGHPEAELGGHGEQLKDAQFSPDGRRVLTSSTHLARLWDADTGASVGTLDRHEGDLTAAVFSPDSQNVLTAANHGALLWDANSTYPTDRPGHQRTVKSAVFSSDGRLALTTSEDGTARLWTPSTGNQSSVLQGKSGVVRALMSPDGTQVLTISDYHDRDPRLWDVGSGSEVALLQGHEVGLPDAQFLLGGKRIVTVSGGVARLWDAFSREEVRRLGAGDASVVDAVSSPTGDRFLTISQDHAVRLWDANTGSEAVTLHGHGRPIANAVFSFDGLKVLITSEGGAAKLWNTDVQQEAVVFQPNGETIREALLSPKGKRVVTISVPGLVARLWDSVSGSEIAVLDSEHGGVKHAVFSPDGATVLTITLQQVADLWNATTGDKIAQLPHKVERAVFSPDGARLVTLQSRGNPVLLWDVAKGAEVVSLSRHESWVESVVFSPDSRHLLTMSRDRSARLWDPITGTETAILTFDAIVTAASFHVSTMLLGDAIGGVHFFDLTETPLSGSGHS